MRDWLTYLPEFVKRVVLQTSTGASVVLGVLAALVSAITGHEVPVEIVGAFLALTVAVSTYAVFREERSARADREAEVRVVARMRSLARNLPPPSPGEQTLRVGVGWEVWTTRDLATEKLALNVIYEYEHRWWQFWKRTQFPQRGVPREGEASTDYRVSIRAGDAQPFSDDALFTYTTRRAPSAEPEWLPRGDGAWALNPAYVPPPEPHWLLELVLVTGVPRAEHRVPVFIDYDEIRSRGTFPPL